jgi:hypothetical protein
MAEITAHYDIGLVMVYESWFSSMPATWRRIAVMHAEYITAARGDVSFLVTPTADLKRVSQSLAEFKSSLPRRVTLEINQL